MNVFGRKEDRAEIETRHEMAAPKGVKVQSFDRRKPARRPLPEHLPRERIVYPGPSACPCCGGGLRKLGEDVPGMLELVPRQWNMIQHVRGNYSRRPYTPTHKPPA